MPALVETADAVNAKEGARAPSDGDAVPVSVPNAARCCHCGRPNPPRARWHADWNGVPHTFCCAGCLGVARTIRAAGLDDFYERRTFDDGAPPIEGDARDEWSHWDETATQAGIVRAGERGTREVSLLVEGIHCGACVWLIESWLAREPGVVSASVNYATRRARVVWDPRRTRLSAVLRAFVAIGYRASPYDPRRREAGARREARTLLLRLAVAGLAMMQVMMFAVPTYVTVDGVEEAHRRLLEWASLTLTLPALLYSASPFFRGAWRDLRHRSAGMDVPVALGLAAAFGGSVWATFTGTGPVYYDSVTMFIALLLLARYIELVARQKAGAAIEALARARPATAERLLDWPSGQMVETVGAASLAPGDLMLVRPGATVAADGDIVDGRASLEEAMLTGESRPRAAAPGDAVLAGSVARDGALIVCVRAAGEATRLAGLERLAERAMGERPRVARFADRAARWFVATLLVLAAGTAVVWWNVDPSRVLAVTFAVLVVSCPCALSLATPAALAAAAGALARRHVVIARTDALETLARVTHVALDKTGTLTMGRMAVVGVELRGTATRDAALALAASLDAVSEHPLARALREAAPAGTALPRVDAVAIVAGNGVEGTVEGRRVRLGRPDFVVALSGRQAPPDVVPADAATTHVALGDASGLIAQFTLADTLRPGAADLVARLSRLGIVPVLISGDRTASVEAIARALGIADARGDAQPEDKRDALVRLQKEGAIVAMVGDGINDAPSLAQAQVSVSLGSATALAQQTADIVVLGDDLGRVADAIAHARRTYRVIRQNLAWAFAYNLVAVPAAAFGMVTPLVAAIGMSASSLLVVGNALRVARFRAADRESRRGMNAAAPT